MHAEVALVAHRGRHLPALGDQLPDQPRTSLLDRHPLEQRRDRDLGHQLSQPGLGHLAGQAVAASRRADRPELAGDRPVPNAPLAIPGIALLEDAARAVPPFRGAAWLQRGRVLRGHRPFIRPRRPPARLRASVLIRPLARTVNWRSAAGPAPPRRHDRPPAKRRGNSYGRRGSTGSRWAVAATRATAQLPNTRLTTLAEGQSPPPSRSSASPHVGAHACASSHMTTATVRSGPAKPASRLVRGHGTSAARSRPGGRPCSRRRRRPCRCATACRRRNHGTRRRTVPSPPAPLLPSDRKSRP